MCCRNQSRPGGPETFVPPAAGDYSDQLASASPQLRIVDPAAFFQPVRGHIFRLRVDLCTVVENSEFLATLFYNCLPPSCRLYLTKVHADFNCDVHFPDLAPFGFPINSANTNLEGLQTDLKLVPVEDDDVQVLSLRYKSALIRGLKYIKPRVYKI